MLPRTCRSIASRLRPISTAFLISFAAGLALAQDVAVTRLPIDTDMTVRLTNLTSHVNYDRSGNSYFIVPVGRYSVQLLRSGEVAYQEVEYIDADSPATRTVNPQRMEIVVGLPDGGPEFDPNVCAALAGRGAAGHPHLWIARQPTSSAAWPTLRSPPTEAAAQRPPKSMTWARRSPAPME